MNVCMRYLMIFFFCNRSNSNTKKSVFESEKEPWDLKHVRMGDSNADWSDRGSIFQAMGSNLVLLPYFNSISWVYIWHSGRNLRLSLRKQDQCQCQQAQRPWNLHSHTWLPSGISTVIICSHLNHFIR